MLSPLRHWAMAEEQHRSYIYKAELCGGLSQFPLTHSPGSIYNILVQHKEIVYTLVWYHQQSPEEQASSVLHPSESLWHHPQPNQSIR